MLPVKLAAVEMNRPVGDVIELARIGALNSELRAGRLYVEPAVVA